MREFEMRQRIEGFLKRRMQGMLAPALGLGLTVAGCTQMSVTPVYSAPNPDAPIGHVEDAPGGQPEAVYSAPFAPDANTADVFVGKDTPPSGPDSAPDLAIAKEPDAGQDTSGEAGVGVDAGTGVDSGADLGSLTTKYMAQLPDAGRDLGAMPLYMAPLSMASAPLG